MSHEAIEHIGLAWRIREGRVEEYERRHVTMWPELEARLRELGMVAATIFRRGNDCYGHFRVRGGWEAHMAAYADDPLGQDWERAFEQLIEFDADPVTGAPERLHYIWSLGDGPQPPRKERHAE